MIVFVSEILVPTNRLENVVIAASMSKRRNSHSLVRDVKVRQAVPDLSLLNSAHIDLLLVTCEQSCQHWHYQLSVLASNNSYLLTGTRGKI